MFKLYSHGSPNGHKISIALEELKLPYTVHQINVFAGEGQTPEFLAINPNGKIPVIHDIETGQFITESNAILLYLADKTGKLMPTKESERWRAIELLFFQSSTIGPMFGQRAYFTIMASETLPYAMKRYFNEGERLHKLLDDLLTGREYFLDEYSIVDIAHFGWFFTAMHMGFSFDKYPNLKTWYDRVGARPAVQKGVTIPSGLPNLPPRKDFAAQRIQ